jgi:hypothetical protein
MMRPRLIGTWPHFFLMVLVYHPPEIKSRRREHPNHPKSLIPKGKPIAEVLPYGFA